jgi:hypothetical protein
LYPENGWILWHVNYTSIKLFRKNTQINVKNKKVCKGLWGKYEQKLSRGHRVNSRKAKLKAKKS